jgi:hypothetical protein
MDEIGMLGEWNFDEFTYLDPKRNPDKLNV